MSDLLITLILGVPFWVLCGWLGRHAARFKMGLHMPYEWRVKNAQGGSMVSFGGGAIPRIPPKGKGWF